MDLIEREPICVSNQTAKKVIYENSEDPTDHKFVVYVIVNNKGYSFDCSDTYPNPYQNNIADIQGMMDSTVISEFTSLDQPIKWIKFEDAGLGITLEHPVGWEIERKESKFEEGPEVTISDSSSNSGEIKIAKPSCLYGHYCMDIIVWILS